MARVNEARLRSAFANVLGTVLAGAAVTSGVGCGGGTTGTTGPGGGGGGTNPEFTSMCTPEILGTTFLKGLRATPELDGAVSRTENAFPIQQTQGQGGGVVPSDDPSDAWKATEGDSVGVLCAKASNQAACLEKVHGFRVLPPTRDACKAQFPGYYYAGTECSVSYILYTRGDEIAVARTQDETKALCGTFDTLSEALWVAQGAGYQTSCSTYSAGSSVAVPPSSQYRTTRDGGYDLDMVKYDNCGTTTYRVLLHVDYAGTLTVVSTEDLKIKPPCAVAGRRPEGLDLARMRVASRDAAAEHFAEMSTLEAASVTAFRRLHRQLAALGAPKELLARVRKATRDEIRHARSTAAIARALGACPARPVIAPPEEAPSLLAVALDNAREGCVRETFGALVAHVQAATARDPEVRAALATIAEEETQHAALSWDIAAWADSRLCEHEREMVAAARAGALSRLAADLRTPPEPRVEEIAGMPASDVALAMLERLQPILLAA